MVAPLKVVSKLCKSPSLRLPIYLYLLFYQSINLSIFLSIYLSIYLSFYLNICIYLSIYRCSSAKSATSVGIITVRKSWCTSKTKRLQIKSLWSPENIMILLLFLLFIDGKNLISSHRQFLDLQKHFKLCSNTAPDWTENTSRQHHR